MILRISAALLVLSACTTKNKTYCDEVTPCTTAARMYCDIDGAYSDPSTCIVTPVDGACNRATPCQAPTAPNCSDDSDGTCQGCTDSDQCGDNLCEVKSGQCVECLTTQDCDGTSTCDAETFICRGCESNTECSAELCIVATGVCAPAAEIVYVANDGVDAASCGDAASPCLSIGFALQQASPARPNILLRDGEYTERLVLSEDVRIHGYDKVLLSASLAAADAAIEVTAHVSLSNLTITPVDATGSDWAINATAEPGQASLTLRDLIFTGMTGGNGQLIANRVPVVADNILIENNTSNATFVLSDTDFRLSDSVVSNNEAGGVRSVVNASQRVIEINRCRLSGNIDGYAAQGGTHTIRDSIISGNDTRGIWVMAGSTVTIERNTITDNGTSGIELEGSSYSIINNLIRGNGRAGQGEPTLGGVQVSGTTNYAEELLFNTFVENAATQGPTSLQCLDSGVLSSGNIFMGTSATLPNEELVSPACSPTYSVFDPNDQLTAGTGNIAADPQFEISAAGEYRLSGTSPCIDSADPAAIVDSDFENDRRPQGPRGDIGYDEYLIP